MKKYILLIFILSISCSKESSTDEIIKNQIEIEEETNTSPNDFNIEVINISYDSATLKWEEAIDPDSDLVTYSIYLNQTLIASDLVELTYQINELQELTNYSGKIVAKDSENNETNKDFSFSTEKYYLKFLKRYDFGQIDYTDTGYALGTPYSMLKTDNNNYIIAGASLNPTGTGSRFFVYKLDYEGNEVWRKFYDYELLDSWCFNISKTSSGYILVGDHHALNLDYDGNIIWYKKIESYDIDEGSAQAQSVKQDDEGNFYIVGGRGSSDLEIQQEGVLTKLNSNGDFVWEKFFKPSLRSYFNDIVINSDNELIILGSTETSGTTYDEYLAGPSSVEQIDFWVLKLTTDGEIIWDKTFGDGKYDFPNQIIKTTDNSFVVVGYGPSIFKIDNSGGLVWSNTELSAYNPTFSIAETSDNGFITTGNFYIGTYVDALIISKFDSNGNLEWEKSYNESYTWISGYCILSENDGGYRIAGNSRKANYYNDEIPNLLIFKTDPEGDFE